MAVLIKLKRGLSSNLPEEANIGEPIWVSDTKDLYIGNGTGQALTKITGAGGGTLDHRELNYRNVTGAHEALYISYDNTSSELLATEVNGAIDEVLGRAMNIDAGVWG